MPDITTYFTEQKAKTGLSSFIDRPEGLYSTKDNTYYQVNESLSFSDACQFIQALFAASKHETTVYPTIDSINVANDAENKINLTLDETEQYKEKKYEEQECVNQIRMIIKEITKRNMPPLIAQKLQRLVEDKTVKEIDGLETDFNNIVKIFHEANKDFADILVSYDSLLVNLSSEENKITSITQEINTTDNSRLTNRKLIEVYQKLIQNGQELHQKITSNKDSIISLKAATLVIKHYDQWIKKVLPLTDIEHYKQQVAVTMSWWKKQRYSFQNVMADVADIFKKDNKNKETADYGFRTLYCKAYELGQERELSENSLREFKTEIKTKSDTFLPKREPCV